MEYILYSAPGTGSQMIEAALRICDVPYRLVTVDYEKAAKGKVPALKKLNPLSRLPTLVTARKEVLTESGAIILHLANLFPQAELVPPANTVENDLFFRLLFILTGEIYPCFTFMDDPSEWVKPVGARAGYRNRVLKHQEELWLYFAKLVESKGPWALGQKFSAIDLYVATMIAWRPGAPWFQKNAPHLFKIAERTRALKEIQKIYHPI